jgi:hypothetical protein
MVARSTPRACRLRARLGTIHRGWYRITRGGHAARSPTSSGNDDHGDRHGNDHEMTTTTAGMMADGPLSPAGLRAIDPCWRATNKEAR